MSAYTHIPVLVAEVVEALRPRPGGRYGDLTIGGGGHAFAILKATGGAGWLLGVDRDGAALKAAEERLAPFGGRFELRWGTYDRLLEWVTEGSLDGVLMDLGVSSPQLDVAARGFSFQADGPLDMRMDPDQALTAATVVNTAPVEELERMLATLGEEPRARRLARRIDEERRMQPLRTTGQLATLIERVAPRGGRLHPATRVFQALRMVVNDELGQLRRGLEVAARALAPGGRLAVISFQGIEAREVKRFGVERTRDYTYDGEVDVPELRRPREPELAWVHRRAVTPGRWELENNVRARSAQLRVLERRGHGADT
ncbi:MAG: 16S rRNA (cytosine(1402)-N(4))-methyltransferase RsmH [Verrucomicrobiae bacterium]|nr:16S rRNA (cytosine(1402)-N(4))-methyltransferase RsmH [Verrucomicrobiae bacterium]